MVRHSNPTKEGLLVKKHSSIVSLIVALIAIAVVPNVYGSERITFLTPLWNDRVQAWYENEAIPAFEARYPDLDVSIEYTDWNGMRERIAVGIAAGVGADVIVTTGEGSARSQGDEGILRPLDSYLQEWDGLEDTLPFALEVQRLDGRTYAVPNTVNLRAYATNVDLMERAGYLADAPIGEWGDWVRQVQRLSGAYNYQDIAAFRANGGQYVEGVFAEADLTWLDDNLRLSLQSPDARAILTHLDNVFQASGGLTAGATPEIFRQAGQFVTASVAVGWIALANIINAERELGPGSIAIPDPAREIAIMPATGLGITTVSQNPDAAWRWIEFLSERENLIRFNDFYGRIPPRMSAIQSSPAMLESPLFARAADVAARFGRPTPFSNRYGSLADIRNQAANIVNAMFRGEMHPDQVAQEIEILWNSRLPDQAAK